MGLEIILRHLLTGFYIFMMRDNIFLMIYNSDLTALHASSEEVSEWIDKDNTAKATDARNEHEIRLSQSKEATSSSSNASGKNAKSTTKYTFISECFFMTARVLNLGLLKALSDFKHLAQVIIIIFSRI